MENLKQKFYNNISAKSIVKYCIVNNNTNDNMSYLSTLHNTISSVACLISNNTFHVINLEILFEKIHPIFTYKSSYKWMKCG